MVFAADYVKTKKVKPLSPEEKEKKKREKEIIDNIDKNDVILTEELKKEYNDSLVARGVKKSSRN